MTSWNMKSEGRTKRAAQSTQPKVRGKDYHLDGGEFKREPQSERRREPGVTRGYKGSDSNKEHCNDRKPESVFVYNHAATANMFYRKHKLFSSVDTNLIKQVNKIKKESQK